MRLLFKSTPWSVARALLGFFVSINLFRCALAAPIEDFSTNHTTIVKRGFIPTDEQADAVLASTNFDGSKTIFFSMPANPRAWATKLGRITIRDAYGPYVFPSNQNGPFWQVPTASDEAKQIWRVLSAAYARAATGDAYVALNPGQVPASTSIWVSVEEPILQQKGISIFQVNAQDASAQPVQIFPPPVAVSSGPPGTNTIPRKA